MYTHNNKIITDCIDWALEHGYNPFDSTHSLPGRRMKIYTAYNEVCKQTPDLMKEALEFYAYRGNYNNGTSSQSADESKIDDDCGEKARSVLKGAEVAA